jgi:probable HAF family extracellular repeat protein
MKSRTFTHITVMALFATLAIPFGLAAQEQQQHKKEHHRYRFLDIGTFGGPASFINPAGNGGPYISRRGTTVGTAATNVASNPAFHIFFCSGLHGDLAFVFHAFALEEGDVTDLGALPPAVKNCSDASAVNASGEIVGGSENGVIDPVLGVTEIRAVLWKDGEIKDLGTLGGNHSQATAINNRGQIVGYALNKIADPFSIIDLGFGGSSNGTQTRAFLWENGHMNDLDTLGGPDAFGIFVNERGQVTGYSYTNSTPNATTGFPTQDPFLWTKENGMIDLGSFGGTSGSPTGLNNRGQVIGSSKLAGDQASDPFLWDDGKLIDLFTDTIGGNPTTANAINDAGEIVGNAVFPNGASDAYLWKNGVATDLGVLAGDCFSEAFAINSRRQVVGQSSSCVTKTTRTFLWDNGTMIDLNAFVPPGSGVQLVEAIAINDRGEIAGDELPPSCAGDPQGNDTQCGHAFVLIPCDDEQTDAEGCEEERESTAAQNHAMAGTETSTDVNHGSLTPEALAGLRARLARRHRIPGLGARRF